MPWVVGIDEAGYGPNLGPLLQSAVGFELPENDLIGWETFSATIRRAGKCVDDRFAIDDSKKIYARGGLAALEVGIWKAFGIGTISLNEFIGRFQCAEYCREELLGECWFDGSQLLPLTPIEQTGIINQQPMAFVVITPTTRFNRICNETESKAAILARGLIELMPKMVASLPIDRSPITFICDKHGGRNFYAAMVQQAFPDSWVVAERESATESSYSLKFEDREIRVVFRPKADGASISVALASMISKYLREVFMAQFNRFWARHVSDLQPTAGYPVDARRYLNAIQPSMAKLGIREDHIWRVR